MKSDCDDDIWMNDLFLKMRIMYLTVSLVTERGIIFKCRKQ